MERLRSLACAITCLTAHWIIIGDWNITAATLAKSLFLKFVSGYVIPAGDIVLQEDAIDFAVCNPLLRTLVEAT